LSAQIDILSPPPWSEYALLDTGHGQKLERFGKYRIVRPEAQALWAPSLPVSEWQSVDAIFQQGNKRTDDSAGEWDVRRSVPQQWLLHYDDSIATHIACWARLTPFRHTGVFPEHCAHWQWLQHQVRANQGDTSVLVLFGYTGFTTLMLAQAGAKVCHVDASRPAVRWAQENQVASGLEAYPIRWIVDDALTFVRREVRRQSQYDVIVMDPPVFGRGPKGQLWRIQESLPALLTECVHLLRKRGKGLLLSAYATTLSSLTLQTVVQNVTQPLQGVVTSGELVLVDQASRPLSTARYACWEQHNE
jgi:23S rRNA (cytosine1962-C5)-methyltransferase